VFFGHDKFSVTEPNDTLFLDYFLKRVLAADEAEAPRRPPGLIRRFVPLDGAADLSSTVIPGSRHNLEIPGLAPTRHPGMTMQLLYSRHSRASVASRQPSQ
jgi:hypothetical protein